MLALVVQGLVTLAVSHDAITGMEAMALALALAKNGRGYVGVVRDSDQDRKVRGEIVIDVDLAIRDRAGAKAGRDFGREI